MVTPDKFPERAKAWVRRRVAHIARQTHPQTPPWETGLNGALLGFLVIFLVGAGLWLWAHWEMLAGAVGAGAVLLLLVRWRRDVRKAKQAKMAELAEEEAAASVEPPPGPLSGPLPGAGSFERPTRIMNPEPAPGQRPPRYPPQ